MGTPWRERKWGGGGREAYETVSEEIKNIFKKCLYMEG